jgi:hypothetical protein
MCAPFAKESVVSKVMSVVPDGVRVLLFTRWRPDEVAAGVSDTAVLPVVRSRGGDVYLHDRLHAKYYRNEHAALIGSANLTATALGWAERSNLELLVSSDYSEIHSLENDLIEESVLATEQIAREIDQLASVLPSPMMILDELSDEPSSKMWLPGLRMPSDLYDAYALGASSLTSRSALAAANDLFALDLPNGLSREQFYLLVGHRLRHLPVFRVIDEYLTEPRRFGEMRELLELKVGLNREQAEQSWQTVVRWMLEFLSTKYVHYTLRHSEIVSLSPFEVSTRV